MKANSIWKMSLFAVFGLFLLSGCSLFQSKEPVVVVEEAINVCVDPPEGHTIVMRSVKPTVIKDEFGIYWIGLTPKDYENLGINMQEIKQSLKEKNAIINYYRKCNDARNEERRTSDIGG
jgi:hypothetical protein